MLIIIIYISFISLGLPDSMLGAAWPAIWPDLGIPVSFAGILQMIIAGGTIVSSMNSGRVLRRFGMGKVTAFSVGMTAVALMGFVLSPSFWWLLLAAVPLGLGAGSVDAGLNSFVAAHYESRHMSWLHSFWGLGALLGPLVLSVLLHNNLSWRSGYLFVDLFQWILVALLIFSVPLWKKVASSSKAKDPDHLAAHPTIVQVIGIRGVPFALVTFLFYCGIEASMSLWGGTYLATVKGLDAANAAFWVSVFFANITIGRFITGFITIKISNKNLIRCGAVLILSGIILILIPLPISFTLAGFLLVGLGCAPIFPCMLHETPVRFGITNAQSVMGVQMAFAYIGTTFLPPLFGLVSSITSLVFFPLFLLVYVFLIIASSERLRNVYAMN